MKRLILGACLTLLFIAGMFRVQFVPVVADDANPANNPVVSQPLVTPDTEDSREFVDETFTLSVYLTPAAPANPPDGPPTPYPGAKVELWYVNSVSGEEKLVDTVIIDDQQNNFMAEFENVVRPIDARWFDQNTRQKFDKPLVDKDYFVYKVVAKHNKYRNISMKETVDVIPSFYPKTQEEIDPNFQPLVRKILRMYRNYNASGVVTSTSGMPISNVKVSVIATFRRGTPRESGIQNGTPIAECTTDIQGRFQMENVPGYSGGSDVTMTPVIEVVAEGYDLYRRELTSNDTAILISLQPEQPQSEEQLQPTQQLSNPQRQPQQQERPQPRPIQRLTQPQQPPQPQPAVTPPAASDLPAIQLFEAAVGDTSDFTLSTAVIRVINALTGEPMPGVSAKVESKFRGIPVAETLSLVADEQGLLKFQYPNQIKFLAETLQRGEAVPLEQRNRIAVYHCEVSIEPSQQGGRMLLASRINLGMVFPSDTKFSDDRVPVINMQEGHLLVGRVVNDRNQAPLATSDDGKPIRIAFQESAYEGEAETYPRSGSPVLEVDENGIFQCYLPEGVCWPFIMPNGDDQIWPRTLAYQQWQKEGVLIKPGKITTVEFRVTPRLDSDNAAPTLPVLEEQLAAARLTMLGGQYELDENRRVWKVVMSLAIQPQQWSIIHEFKHLTTVDITNIPVIVMPEDYFKVIFQQIFGLTTLKTLIVNYPLPVDTNAVPYIPFEAKTIEGRFDMENFFKETVEHRALYEKGQFPVMPMGGMGMSGGGMGGIMMYAPNGMAPGGMGMPGTPPGGMMYGR